MALTQFGNRVTLALGVSSLQCGELATSKNYPVNQALVAKIQPRSWRVFTIVRMIIDPSLPIAFDDDLAWFALLVSPHPPRLENRFDVIEHLRIAAHHYHTVL